MSGGVDSAVSALLLKDKGFQVEGLFMKNWDEDDGACCHAEDDLKSARQAAKSMKIALHTVNFSSEYWEQVFQYLLRGYYNGETPNPDILCNRYIKFDLFLNHTQEFLDANKIAMGHYAQIKLIGNQWRLAKSIDIYKDQTYFLYRLTQKQLQKSMFPLASLTKREVREIARKHGFECSSRRDSMGICFIGKRHFQHFLANYIPTEHGEIVDQDGKVVGEHLGAWFYTIGQRKGLGIGGKSKARPLAWYVASKDTVNNTITVVQGNHHPLLYRQKAMVRNLHWIGNPPDDNAKLQCKIRHQQSDQGCKITYVGIDRLYARFCEPQRAVSPGQSIVFYKGIVCLGGGVIDSL